METLAIPDLLTYLQSHPSTANFNLAAGILQSRHDSLLHEHTIKKAGLRSRCKALKRTLADQSSQLEESLTKAEDARKRAQAAEDKLDFFIQAHKDLYPDRIIQVSDSEDDAAAASASAGVVDAGVIALENGDDGRAHLPTPLPRWKSPFVFYSDSEDEGGGVITLEDGDDCEEEEDVIYRLWQMTAEAKDTEGSSVPKSSSNRRKAKRKRIKRSISGIKRSLSSKR